MRETEPEDLSDPGRWVSYSITDLWPAWHQEARCHDQGTDAYFGVDEEHSITTSISTIRRASKLCDVCPVFEDCLRSALENREEFGVWAGTSGRVRKRIFKLLDNGSTTVDEVIEVFVSGQGSKYRQEAGDRSGLRAGSARPARGVLHEDGGQERQRDLRADGLHAR